MDEAPSLSSYLVFNTVAKNGNLSGAAKELLISQPAVSRSLQKLEAGLSAKLFIRNSRGVRLTNEGEILYEHTKKAFDSIEHAEKAIKRINMLGLGYLRFGVSSCLCKLLFTPDLKGIVSAFPHLSLDISLKSSSDLFSSVENGDLDAAIVTKPASVHRLDYVETVRFNDIFVTSPEYLMSLSEQGITDTGPSLLNKARLILPKKGNYTRDLYDKALTASSVTPASVVEVGAFDQVLDFAASGLGIAIIPKEFAEEKLKKGVLKDLKFPLSVPGHSAGIIYDKTELQNSSVSQLIDHIAEAQSLKV